MQKKFSAPAVAMAVTSHLHAPPRAHAYTTQLRQLHVQLPAPRRHQPRATPGSTNASQRAAAVYSTIYWQSSVTGKVNPLEESWLTSVSCNACQLVQLDTRALSKTELLESSSSLFSTNESELSLYCLPAPVTSAKRQC